VRIQDEAVLALTVWRENRGGGLAGMQSVANVILNRAARHGLTPYEVCVAAQQFSSMTAKGDPELNLWPNDGDVQWLAALDLAAQSATGSLTDITHGATLYYAPAGQVWKKRFVLPSGASVVFPDSWNQSAVEYVGTIAGQLFFVER